MKPGYNATGLFEITSFQSTAPLLGLNQGCGGYLSNIRGNISSPDINFDGKYENNLDCVWRIFVPLNKVINMTFTAFQLEDPSEGICKSDYVN
eukprot:g40911.t1